MSPPPRSLSRSLNSSLFDFVPLSIRSEQRCETEKQRRPLQSSPDSSFRHPSPSLPPTCSRAPTGAGASYNQGSPLTSPLPLRSLSLSLSVSLPFDKEPLGNSLLFYGEVRWKWNEIIDIQSKPLRAPSPPCSEGSTRQIVNTDNTNAVVLKPT